MKIRMLSTLKVAHKTSLVGGVVYDSSDLPHGVKAKTLIKDGFAVETESDEPAKPGEAEVEDNSGLTPEQLAKQKADAEAQAGGETEEDEEVDEEQEHEEEDPETKEKKKVRKVVKVKKKKSRG